MAGEKEETRIARRDFLKMTGGATALAFASGMVADRLLGPGQASGAAPAVQQVITSRKLSASQAEAALKTFVPGGQMDEFYMFASGGHSGQMHVIGVPSMRVLKTIAVFTPEPWQGYGYGDVASMNLLQKGSGPVRLLTGGDTHHPEFSRTNGEYDGEWAFIGDKLSARKAAVSLRNFKTTDIIRLPNMQCQHGGACATPNTEYVLCGSQYPAPWEPGKGFKPGVTYYPLTESNYKDYFRGAMSFTAFSRQTGAFDMSRSFEIELPPYMQDLEAVGWGPSDGWAFTNSFDTELAYGGVMEGNVPLEAGASKNDFDYLHIVDWKKAEQLVKAGKATNMNGVDVLSLDTAAKEGVLFFAPEPKSPHGCDIAPSGKYIVVGGKLAPVVTLYDVDKIKAAIANGSFEGHDPYGVPILKFQDVIAGQVNMDLGPLHNEFDGHGYGYVSCFIANEVVKYTLGPPDYTGANPYQVVDKISINYNIGHLAVPESGSPSPKGKYLVALNKWSIDRFLSVGPLRPQNLQLIDISGQKMQMLSDMAVGFAEPHYAKMISTAKIKPLDAYPVGTDPSIISNGQFQKSPYATEPGKERVDRHTEGNKWVTEVWMTVIRSHFTPDIIHATQGDIVRIHLTNIETTIDATHGFGISQYNIIASIEPGGVVNLEFAADYPGVFDFYCLEFCSPLHLEMMGWLDIKPS